MKTFFVLFLILLTFCVSGQNVMKTVKVNRNCNLNTQPMPGTNFMQIKKGQAVDVLEIADAYYKVNYKGNVGFVSELFIYDTDLIKIAKDRKDQIIAKQDSIAKANRIAHKLFLVEQYGAHRASLIEKKQVCIGMTMGEALESWGDPSSINKTTYSFGVHEQWVYEGEDFKNRYLYFEDGVLTTIQE